MPIAHHGRLVGKQRCPDQRQINVERTGIVPAHIAIFAQRDENSPCHMFINDRPLNGIVEDRIDPDTHMPHTTAIARVTFQQCQEGLSPTAFYRHNLTSVECQNDGLPVVAYLHTPNRRRFDDRSVDQARGQVAGDCPCNAVFFIHSTGTSSACST